MLLTELLTPDQVVMPVVARDKSGVIAELTRHLANRWGCDYPALLQAVQEREAGGSTGIGFGVAIPHARSAGVPELSLVCGVSPSPVSFDSIDGEPVRLFFLIVGPPDSAGQHVKVLGRIARLVRHEHVRQRLFGAATPQEFYNVLLDAEAR
ncbi:MAG: PTS sugar transporter subunit IIA [Gemmatimonadota bacterium]|nr:PTS sugar transporter subunit IIA [Gemmatimonadota bacterium]